MPRIPIIQFVFYLIARFKLSGQFFIIKERKQTQGTDLQMKREKSLNKQYLGFLSSNLFFYLIARFKLSGQFVIIKERKQTQGTNLQMKREKSLNKQCPGFLSSNLFFTWLQDSN